MMESAVYKYLLYTISIHVSQNFFVMIYPIRIFILILEKNHTNGIVLGKEVEK